LFWLSLFPFATGWMGENHFAPLPTALYGAVLLLAAVAYWILQRVIIRSQGAGSLLAHAVGRDLKGKLSPLVTRSPYPRRSRQPGSPNACTWRWRLPGWCRTAASSAPYQIAADSRMNGRFSGA